MTGYTIAFVCAIAVPAAIAFCLGRCLGRAEGQAAEIRRLTSLTSEIRRSVEIPREKVLAPEEWRD